MSQNRIGQSPTEYNSMILGCHTMDSTQHISTNITCIIALVDRNLNANFTVPSIFSCEMAVGTYDSKLNRSCKS